MQEVWRNIACVTGGKPASMWPHVHDVAYVSIWFCKRSRGVFTKRLPLHVFGGISCLHYAAKVRWMEMGIRKGMWLNGEMLTNPGMVRLGGTGIAIFIVSFARDA